MKIVFDYNVFKMTTKLDAHSSTVQSENVWHANGNTKDDMDGSTLYGFQTFTLGLGKTVLLHH